MLIDMQRWTAIGALMGALIGWGVQFLFPRFVWYEILFNVMTRESAGLPTGELGSGGSILVVGFLTPFIFGLIGASIGWILYTLFQRQK